MERSHKLPLRLNVCMLLINKEDLLFLGERSGEAGHWQFPQGGCEEGATPEDNVLRELVEELGAGSERFEIIKKLDAKYDYEWQTPPGYAVGRFRGQSQSFWLVRYLGADEEINLFSGEQELMSWRWCSVEEVKLLAEPRRLQGYLPALEQFQRLFKSNSTPHCKGVE